MQRRKDGAKCTKQTEYPDPHYAGKRLLSILRAARIGSYIPSYNTLPHSGSAYVYWEESFGSRCNVLLPHYELQGSAPTFQATMYRSSILGCKVRLIYLIRKLRFPHLDAAMFFSLIISCKNRLPHSRLQCTALAFWAARFGSCIIGF